MSRFLKVWIAVASFLSVGLWIWWISCPGKECGGFQLVSMWIWPSLPRVYHYRTRDFETFMKLQSSSAWRDRFVRERGIKDWTTNTTSVTLTEFHRRNASGAHDTSALRWLPQLTEISGLSISQRLPRYHHQNHCVLGYDQPGTLHCRTHFLTAQLFMVQGQEGFLDEWVRFHSALGVDHYQIFAHSVKVTDVFREYVENGIVEIYTYPLPENSSYASLDKRLRQSGVTDNGVMKSVALQELSSFWVLFIDIDEYAAPPEAFSNFKSFLLPYTRMRKGSMVSRDFKQITFSSLDFGSGAWMHPPNMPEIQAYTERTKVLSWNGKSVALLDAIDVTHEQIGYPHRFPLKREFYADSALWLFNLGLGVFWKDPQSRTKGWGFSWLEKERSLGILDTKNNHGQVSVKMARFISLLAMFCSFCCCHCYFRRVSVVHRSSNIVSPSLLLPVEGLVSHLSKYPYNSMLGVRTKRS